MLHMYKGMTLDIDRVIIDENSGYVKTGSIIEGRELVLPLAQFDAGYHAVDFKKSIDTLDYLRKKGLLAEEPVTASEPAA